MRLVLSAQGTVILRGSADEVWPEAGLLQRDMHQLIATAYQFSSKPNPAAPAQMGVPQVFQQGKLVKDGNEYVIQQIAVFPNADAITAANTDIAELVMDDYIARLEKDLKFRYTGKSLERSYFSGVVVQFDRSIEGKISAFSEIEKILARESKRELPFKTKTLAFGAGDATTPQPGDLLEAGRKADFSMQRRANEPYSENKYFCSGGFSTSQLLRVIQEIEDTLGK